MMASAGITVTRELNPGVVTILMASDVGAQSAKMDAARR
jgi:ABC-type transporter Mla maintaining outer membrane lipid asymmetry permease subunit MlaE